MGEIRNAYKVLDGIPEEKRPGGRPICNCSCNIRIDLRQIRCEGVDQIHLVQDRDQWRALSEHGNELSGCIK
jgi:hypothetical protein